GILAAGGDPAVEPDGGDRDLRPADYLAAHRRLVSVVRRRRNERLLHRRRWPSLLSEPALSRWRRYTQHLLRLASDDLGRRSRAELLSARAAPLLPHLPCGAGELPKHRFIHRLAKSGRHDPEPRGGVTLHAVRRSALQCLLA